MDSSSTVESLQSLLREQSRIFLQLKQNDTVENADDEIYLGVLNDLDRISQLADKLSLPLLSASSILIIEITDEIFSDFENSSEQISIVLSWLEQSQHYIIDPKDTQVVIDFISTLPQEYKKEMNELYFDSEIMDENAFNEPDDVSILEDSGDIPVLEDFGEPEDELEEELENEFDDQLDDENDPWSDGMDFDDILAEEDAFDSTDAGMLQILAKEFAALLPRIKDMLEMHILGEIGDLKVASKDCFIQLERLQEAGINSGYDGIQLVCKFLADNVVDLQPLHHDDRTKRLQLLEQFFPVFVSHLENPKDDSLCLEILDHLSLQGWIEPLDYTKQRKLLSGLVKESELGDDTSSREKTVSLEQVKLDISNDATPDLIDAFFVESPHYAEDLTAAIGHIAKGENVQQNLLSAQRISHTLKGSANLLGVSGIANLAHYLEDIFEYILNHNISPEPELAYVMQETADTIEMMIESIEDGTTAPESSLAVLQSLLDWINRLENNRDPLESTEMRTVDTEVDGMDIDELDIDIDIDEDLDADLEAGSDSVSEPNSFAIPEENIVEEIVVEEIVVQDSIIEASEQIETQPILHEDTQNDLLSSRSKENVEPFLSHDLIDESIDRNDNFDRSENIDLSVNNNAKDPNLEYSSADSLIESDTSQNTVINEKPIFIRKKLQRIESPSSDLAQQKSQLSSKSKEIKQATELAVTEMLRVPRDLIDNILNVVGEASISLGETLEKLQGLSERGAHMRNLDGVLQTRRFELEDLVNVKGVSNQQKRLQIVNGRSASQSDFDSLEMDEYNEFYGATHSYIEAVADTRFVAREITEDVSSLETIFIQQRRLNRALQDMVMSTRMIAVSSVSARMQRAVRQASRMTGKDAELNIVGEDLLIDGDVLAKLADPLMHILRNAVDHGIETKQVRLEKGKEAIGKIQLTFEQLGNHITVTCTDDGMGLDYDLILNKAKEKDLITDQQLDNNAIARLILHPGFSTRTDTTQVSGRGVGMDVVNNTVTGLKGSVHIGDNKNTGTLISLRIPVTLLTNHSILVDAGSEQYAIPSNALEQILTPGAGELGRFGNMLSYRLDRDSYPVKTLNGLLGMPELALDDLDLLNEKPVILVQVDEQVTAVLVDNLISTFELVVKSCGKYIGELDGISGVSLLGNGQVVPVIDLAQLVRAGTQSVITRRQTTETKVSEAIKILIVDDSLTVRNSLAELVSDAGYKPILARDGLEALKELDKDLPDLVLTDLEMPRMNGLELASYIRTNSRLSALPVVMITSRTMQKHREQSMASGVNAYVTKPYVPEDLMVLLSEQIRSGVQ